MAKHDEDLGDVQAIYADIGRFRRMTIPDLIKHYEEHPEDKLHHVYLPNRSHLPMSRDAGIRFGELAWRHQQSDPAGDDLDLESLDKSIRERFVAMFIANRLPIQRSNVQKMLHSAAKASRKEHERLTHYVPCVVVAGSDPVEFTIGPLRFLTTQKFFEENRKKIEEDLLGFPANETGAAEKIREPTSRPEETARIKQQLLDSVIEYYQQYPWIAELTVPPCDAAESGRRAETATQGALDLLKLLFGYYGFHFRLGNAPKPAVRTFSVRRAEDGKFHRSFRVGGEGALVNEGWFEDLARNAGWVLATGGDFLRGYLDVRRKTNHTGRWLDALNWYGQAVSERLPTAQVVKFVAALERLTTTKKPTTQETTDIVTRRTALLATQDPSERTKIREDAVEIYGWRSDLMHGRRSPLARGMGPVLRKAFDVVPKALLGALDLFDALDKSKKKENKDLERFFVAVETQLAKP